MSPAMRNLVPAMRKGGIVSIAKRIARYVDPQIMYTDVSARAICQRRLGCGNCRVRSLPTFSNFVLTLNPCRIRLMPSRVGSANSEILLDPVLCFLWKGVMQLTCHRESSLRN